jgi:hypothetical protein
MYSSYYDSLSDDYYECSKHDGEYSPCPICDKEQKQAERQAAHEESVRRQKARIKPMNHGNEPRLPLGSKPYVAKYGLHEGDVHR